MSLILDALRKSEAERHRGKSPDLFASTPGLPIRLRERLRLWPVLVFLLLLLASAYVIWRGESRRGSGEADIAAPVVVQADAGVEVIDPPRGAAIPAAVAVQPPSVDRSVTPAVPAGPITPSATNVAPLAPANSNAAAPSVAAQPAPAQPLPALPPPPAPVAEAPTEESLPSVAILDSATRGSLPPLKLSMHVYGDDAAKRFAIIDGKRVSAGSLLGSAVVEAIRRDGVVVNVNGQRVLVPKP